MKGGFQIFQTSFEEYLDRSSQRTLVFIEETEFYFARH